jgi:hypothetical protein
VVNWHGGFSVYILCSQFTYFEQISGEGMRDNQ